MCFADITIALPSLSGISPSTSGATTGAAPQPLKLSEVF
jgi:hypothetical protein